MNPNMQVYSQPYINPEQEQRYQQLKQYNQYSSPYSSHVDFYNNNATLYNNQRLQNSIHGSQFPIQYNIQNGVSSIKNGPNPDKILSHQYRHSQNLHYPLQNSQIYQNQGPIPRQPQARDSVFMQNIKNKYQHLLNEGDQLEDYIRDKYDLHNKPNVFYKSRSNTMNKALNAHSSISEQDYIRRSAILDKSLNISQPQQQLQRSVIRPLSPQPVAGPRHRRSWSEFRPVQSQKVEYIPEISYKPVIKRQTNFQEIRHDVEYQPRVVYEPVEVVYPVNNGNFQIRDDFVYSNQGQNIIHKSHGRKIGYFNNYHTPKKEVYL